MRQKEIQPDRHLASWGTSIPQPELLAWLSHRVAQHGLADNLIRGSGSKDERTDDDTAALNLDLPPVRPPPQDEVRADSH